MDEGTIAVVLIFPASWPPERDTCLFSRTEGSSVLRVMADTRGRLGLHISHVGGGGQSCVFQPVTIPGGGRAVLIATWSPSVSTLQLNGRELQPAVVIVRITSTATIA